MSRVCNSHGTLPNPPQHVPCQPHPDSPLGTCWFILCYVCCSQVPSGQWGRKRAGPRRTQSFCWPSVLLCQCVWLLMGLSLIGPCDSQPCQNGGTCIPEGPDRYRCLCPLAFGGEANCGMCMRDLDLPTGGAGRAQASLRVFHLPSCSAESSS